MGRDARAGGAAAMISSALARRTEELAGERAAFAVATVVRVTRPSSVHPGDSALVLADGTIEGFVGGVCAADQSERVDVGILGGGDASADRRGKGACLERDSRAAYFLGERLRRVFRAGPRGFGQDPIASMVQGRRGRRPPHRT